MEPSDTTLPEKTSIDQSSNTNKKTFWGSIREWVQVIVIALVISLPIRYFIAEPFIVNGASMDPTFATGQFLIVDRLTYRFENPSRGDVIVFKYPNNPSVYYIKRIVGLPGEIIDIQEGKISITKSVTSTTTNATTTFSSTLKVLLNEPYVENIHRSYDNFHTELSPNEYFVMGDNRAESSDSRVWGPLDKNLIVGRPIVRLLPITSVSILPGEYNQK